MLDYNSIPCLTDPQKIFDLTDRVVVICGGAGKMGQNFAEVLSNVRAKVYLLDRDEEVCEKIAREITGRTKGEVYGRQCNMGNKAEITDSFNRIVSEEGRLDVVIYNVYAKPDGYYKGMEEYDAQTWEKVMSVNVSGAFLSCQEAIKQFKTAGKAGNIILTLSTYGLVGPDLRIYENLDSDTNIYGGGDALTTPLVYSVSKSGLLGMVKYLAASCGAENIRVNGLTPGGVYDSQEEQFHQAYISRVPLGRMATWSEYNGAILYLASDASRYMTGANLVVDGGWTVW